MNDAGVAFLARFRRFGSDPSRATYLALFHPDARLLDAGMPAPLTVAEIPAHIEAVLAVAQGFRMTPERWRQHDATLFVEAYNETLVAGPPCRWRSLYVCRRTRRRPGAARAALLRPPGVGGDRDADQQRVRRTR